VLENQASSLPVYPDFVAALLSVPYRKALPNMGRAFQFVDHRDGVILNRNLALTGGVYQELVASKAELSRTLLGRQLCRRAQIGPLKFRLFSQLVQSIHGRQSTWLRKLRHIR